MSRDSGGADGREGALGRCETCGRTFASETDRDEHACAPARATTRTVERGGGTARGTRSRPPRGKR